MQLRHFSQKYSLRFRRCARNKFYQDSVVRTTPSSSAREEPPPSYSSAVMQRFESFENLMAGYGAESYGSPDEEEPAASENPQYGKALYEFTAGGDDELNLTAGEDVEIDYEVDGWFYVKKKKPGRDGKMAGLVPVLYVSQP